MIALAQVAREPVLFNNLQKQRGRLLARSSVPGENPENPGPLPRLQVVSSGGRLKPSSDLTPLFSWVTKTTADFKTDVLCSCGLNLKLR